MYSFHVAVVLIPNTIQCHTSLKIVIRYTELIFWKFCFQIPKFYIPIVVYLSKNMSHICFTFDVFSTFNFNGFKLQNRTPKLIPKMVIGYGTSWVKDFFIARTELNFCGPLKMRPLFQDIIDACPHLSNRKSELKQKNVHNFWVHFLACPLTWCDPFCFEC